MVGKRGWTADSHPKDAPYREAAYRNGDIEAGYEGQQRSAPNSFRFRDAVHETIGKNRRECLKKALLENINREDARRHLKSDVELKDIKNKRLRAYYEAQNEQLEDRIEVDTLVMYVADDVIDSMNPDPDNDGILEREGALREVGDDVQHFLPDEEKEKRDKAAWRAKWAININVVVNVLLLIAKIIAASYSSSLSLIASLVDSALDLLCTIIIWSTNRLVALRLRSLKRRFPVGRRRLEPIGILVFSIIMIISFLQILQESVQKILPGASHKVIQLPPIAIAAMAGTVVVKGIIWFGCKPIKTTQVQALAQDCKTDVIFNTASLLFPLIGHAAHVWWLDPVGAGLLSVFIIYDWGETSFENVTRLSGTAVSPRLLQKLTYLAYRFGPVVNGFKRLTAYHAGDGVWAEVDVLMEEKTPLHRSHDVAETLQYCCEGLSEIDRAFVTTDYTSQGPTGHTSG